VAAALADVEVTATIRPDQVRLSPHASTGPDAVERVRAALADPRLTGSRSSTYRAGPSR
jgi:hypothetical protein